MAESKNPIDLHHQLEAIWRTPKGWKALAAVNHSVIGMRFIITAIVFFLIGGVLAMMIRSQLAGPETDWLTPAAYNQIFTMHGTIMMFLFAIPLIEGLSLYLLPKILGARDLAFPMLSAFGYWCYLFGGLILLAALLVGAAPDGGWFMYVPLSSKPFTPGINADVWLLGVTFVEVSAICAAVEFIVTVLKVRAGGMALGKMPLLAWYLLITAAMMLFGFPPLILGSILLELERAFGWAFFDPARGGAPLLWQHLFWLFGHPEVYIIFLPAAGIVTTVIASLAGRPIVGYSWIVLSLIALGFLSFLLWAHHMFTTGIPGLALGFFSFASLLVVIPTAIQIFSWIATLWRGKPRLELPMRYVCGFLFIFIAGGLTGIMVALIPFDVQAHDTYFVVAHLHYVLVGGFLFPLLAGLYYWLPHRTGVEAYPILGKTAFWIIFVAFNAAFLPMHWTGLIGMRRRIASYEAADGFAALNLLSSIAAFALAIGFALVVVDTVISLRFSRRVARDPWKAPTLEWQMPIPPPSYNFASLPHVDDRHPAWRDNDLGARLARGEGYLGDARRRRRETLCVDARSGAPEQILVYPEPTLIPLLTASALAFFVLSMLAGFYTISLLGLAGVFICVWRWLWKSGTGIEEGPLAVGRAASVPAHFEHPRPPSWWGLVFTILADATLFVSLIFGVLFLATAGPNWPPINPAGPPFWLTAVAAVTSAAGALASLRTLKTVESKAAPSQTSLVLVAALSAAETGLLFACAMATFGSVREHAFFASITTLAIFAALHAFMALAGALYAIFRIRRGFASPARSVDIRAPSLWRLYASLVTFVSLAVIALLSGLAA